jgi:GT2 family glycosyltransferase
VTDIALAVPNLNQGRFLQAALDSIHASAHRVHVALLDAGSTDASREVIARSLAAFSYWRSHADDGQAAAVNEGIAELCARVSDVEFVGWLNADDFFLPGALDAMAGALEAHADWVAVTGGGVLADEHGRMAGVIETSRFSAERFATRCTICQPASLIRRGAWERIGGLDASLDMCFDYDLWWRLARLGPIGYLDRPLAASRDHRDTKTRGRRETYFREARRIVSRERGTVPWHWYISEALEREARFELGRRPAVARRVRAGVLAVLAFASERWLRRSA